MSVTLGIVSDINLDSEYVTEEVYIFFKLAIDFFGEFSSCIKFVLFEILFTLKQSKSQQSVETVGLLTISNFNIINYY